MNEGLYNTENENQNGKANPIKQTMQNGLKEVLESNGNTYEEEITNNIIDFNYIDGENQYNGSEGFYTIINILKNNNVLDSMLFEIQDSGYIDYDELNDYIFNYLEKIQLGKTERNINIEKQVKGVNEKNNMLLLNNIYTQFNLDKLESFNKYLSISTKEIDTYLQEHPEDNENREELIYSYILIKNKESILTDYKNKIGSDNNYTIEGFNKLSNNITNVEQNIETNYIDFTNYIYTNNQLEDSLSKSQLSNLVKSKIKNAFGGIDKDDSVNIENNVITINNKRIILDNGQISAEIFKGNYNIPLEINYPLELIDMYKHVFQIDNSINIYKQNRNKIESFITNKQSELNDYIDDGSDNTYIKELKKILTQYTNQIENINQNIELLINQKIIINNQIKELELKNKIQTKIETKRVKNVLDFLDDIGFNMLPQKTTDKLIEYLNGYKGLSSMLGFNGYIDFTGGSLGIEKDTDLNNISTPEKVIFARFFNIFISGNEDEPINIDALIKGYNPIGNKNTFKLMLANKNMLNGDLSLSVGYQNIDDYLNKNKK